jgi:hypothetical protein
MAYSASSKVVLAIASTTLGLVMVGLAPAQAAKINFSFVTQDGSTGSFILNTDIPPSPEPALFFLGGGVVEEGIGYIGAVSDFSFFRAGEEISNPASDFVVYPTIPLRPSGFPILSSVQAPATCSIVPDISCSLNIDIAFFGELAALPELPSAPEAYFPFQIIGDALPDGDLITSFDIALIPDEPAAVPEPGSASELLALGLMGAGWSLKRRTSERSFLQL